MRYWVGCGTKSGFGFESLTFGGITLRTRGPLTVLYLIVETKPITSCEGFVAELTVVGYGTETFLFVFDLIGISSERFRTFGTWYTDFEMYRINVLFQIINVRKTLTAGLTNVFSRLISLVNGPNMAQHVLTLRECLFTNMAFVFGT